jgi:hypothetical protein
MGQTKTLGGDRLGSGKKQTVHLKGYERSTHDLSYIWRSTMSAGTLVPFMCEVALPGDTFDIELDCNVLTHPTVGPLFGSFKVQLDIFQAPIRLYQGTLHNNKLGIGMNMAQIKLPVITLQAYSTITTPQAKNIDNFQINPSNILSYLGIRGIGASNYPGYKSRDFNAIPLLAYWEIYKNYYANKQEQGGMISNQNPAPAKNISGITYDTTAVAQAPGGAQIQLFQSHKFVVTFATTPTNPQQILLHNTTENYVSLSQVATKIASTSTTETYEVNGGQNGQITFAYWNYASQTQITTGTPVIKMFDLDTIDQMREKILQGAGINPAFNVLANAAADSPYESILEWDTMTGYSPYMVNQGGLALKTYQSDLLNNWINTETIDGMGGISAVTAIDTSAGSFTIDTLNLSKKVYDMLNRVAVSGGTYDDWLDAVYDNDRITRAESPIYHGGLSKELIFQAVVSNSDSEGQPLGTLAGRGTMANKHKGGKAIIRVDEPSYIIAIVSLTPRLDYSQGNKWDVNLQTMDDLHKPALDEIGFQELITEQAAWFGTDISSGEPVYRSIGKQPAWINYMTNVNQTRGNFAIQDNEMFMTLNRSYEYDPTTQSIKDMTTIIDPTKYNQIFAETALDAQNFWTQIAVNITARRKMSAKVMPNL